jgi:hypothetical protein
LLLNGRWLLAASRRTRGLLRGGGAFFLTASYQRTYREDNERDWQTANESHSKYVHVLVHKLLLGASILSVWRARRIAICLSNRLNARGCSLAKGSNKTLRDINEGLSYSNGPQAYPVFEKIQDATRHW